MAEQELSLAVPPCLNLVSAFESMEPTEYIVSLARECGGGLVTESVQRFIWEHCLREAIANSHGPYVKNLLKKLISEIESKTGDVLDELYELYADYMTKLRDEAIVNGYTRICKCISFHFPEGKLKIPLQCSLNMLEGDTGCSIWPSSLFLSEFILSFPETFSNKSCFEVGSGVGLVGICLAHVKASKVILTDGDISTLANMKLNLELNHIVEGHVDEDQNAVKCIYMPWESASETELRDFMPDVILAADVIYDPSCLPHLVKVLATLLKSRTQSSVKQNQEFSLDGKHTDKEVYSTNNGKDQTITNGATNTISSEGPVAYIASVIRNIDTFNCFLNLADQANLSITDITEKQRPLRFLTYMRSYDRSSIKLFTVSCK